MLTTSKNIGLRFSSYKVTQTVPWHPQSSRLRQLLIRVCIECAKDHPDQLDRGVPDFEAIIVAESSPDVVIAAQAAVKDATHGLNSFLVKPPGVTGEKLFSHMRYRSIISPTAKASPSHHLDVAITDSQREVLNVTHMTALTKREIMKDAAGVGQGMKLAARKLDSLGSIRPHSGLVNNEEKLAKMKNQVGLAKSIADIQAQDKAATLKKKDADTHALLLLAANAREKLSVKNGDVSKMTKKEICSILLACYGALFEESKYAKPVLVQMLSEKIEKNPEMVVVSPVAAAPGAAHTAVAAAALAAAPRMMNRVSDAAVVAAAISAIPAREPTL